MVDRVANDIERVCERHGIELDGLSNYAALLAIIAAAAIESVHARTARPSDAAHVDTPRAEPQKAPHIAPVMFMTVKQFCAQRALPRTTFYAEVKAGHIKPVKRGDRTLIHVDEAKRYDAALLAGRRR